MTYLLFGSILLIVLLANFAEKRPRLFPVIYMILAALVALIGTFGIFSLLASLVDLLPEQGVELAELPPPSVGIALVVGALVGGILLIPAVRRRLAVFLPIRPESPVHLTALLLAVLLVDWSLVNLFWVGGVEGLQASAENVPISLLIVQAFVLVFVALFGVGFLIRRPWREVVERLGLTGFDWRSLLVAVAATVVLFAINFTIAGLWMLLDPDQAEAISDISNIMLGEFDSLGSILLLSVLSSFSEEILFRGAVQPRLGLVVTSFLFAFVHLQYAISPATLIILLIGVILGLVRRYFGTWAAIITHFSYNFGLLLMGLVASKLFEMM